MTKRKSTSTKSKSAKKTHDWSKEDGNAKIPEEMILAEEQKSFLERTFRKIKLTDKQKLYEETIYKNEIIFAYGPAGSSKTFSMCFAALKLLFSPESKYDKIIICKPIKEAGEELGFLPGDANDKIAPYAQSYVDNFEQILGQRKIQELFEKGKIEFSPLAYMRGRTLRNCIVLLDEAQNTIESQLIMFITRKGFNCRMVIAGDISQYDIQNNRVILHKFIDMLKDIDKIGFVEFTKEDIVRDPILQEITDRYERTFKK